MNYRSFTMVLAGCILTCTGCATSNTLVKRRFDIEQKGDVTTEALEARIREELGAKATRQDVLAYLDRRGLSFVASEAWDDRLHKPTRRGRAKVEEDGSVVCFFWPQGNLAWAEGYNSHYVEFKFRNGDILQSVSVKRSFLWP